MAWHGMAWHGAGKQKSQGRTERKGEREREKEADFGYQGKEADKPSHAICGHFPNL